MDVSKSVLKLTKDGKVVGRYRSILKASKESGIDPSGISKVCKGKRKTCGGFIWKYGDSIPRDHPKGGRIIPGFSNYLAFPDGRIYSKISGIFLKFGNSTGYEAVSLIDDNGLRKTRCVHRFIALTFTPNIEKKSVVNHKNGKKDNNSSHNLEWVTQSENIKHAHDTGLIIRTSRKVTKYDTQTGKKIKEYMSCKEAAEDSGVSSRTVSNHAKGKVTSHRKDVFFRYSEPDRSIKRDYVEGEIWKPIPNLPNYEISSHGRVYSTRSKIILRSHTHESGYVTLKIKRGKNYKIHQLVTVVFIGSPPEGEEKHIVHHKDANPSNNHVENLEWITPNKNASESYRTGNRKMKRVKEVSEDGETIKIYTNAVELAKELGVQYQTVYKACTGKTKRCKGKILRYED